MLKIVVLGLVAALMTLGFTQNEMEPVLDSTSSDSPNRACLDSTQVSVNKLAEPLPTNSDSLHHHLWEDFILGPEPKRFFCPVAGWRERAESFSNSLIQKAKAMSLDHESLGNCLAQVMSQAGLNAYIPISAAFADFDGKPAWVILVNWEWADSSDLEVLGHTRVYVLNAGDASRLAFATCS